ncbi:hypothetical protein ACQ5SK_25275 [Bradyrhizobium japonicum]
MIDTESLDLDDGMTRLRLRLRNVPIDEAVQTAEFFKNDSAHDGSPDVFRGEGSDRYPFEFSWPRKSPIAAAISRA